MERIINGSPATSYLRETGERVRESLDKNPDFRSFSLAAAKVTDQIVEGWNAWYRKYGRGRRTEDVISIQRPYQAPEVEASGGEEETPDTDPRLKALEQRQGMENTIGGLSQEISAVGARVAQVETAVNQVNRLVGEVREEVQALTQRVGDLAGQVTEQVSQLVEAARQSLVGQLEEGLERVAQSREPGGITDEDLNARISSEVSRQLEQNRQSQDGQRPESPGSRRRGGIFGRVREVVMWAALLGSGAGAGWIGNDIVKDEPARQDVPTNSRTTSINNPVLTINLFGGRNGDATAGGNGGLAPSDSQPLDGTPQDGTRPDSGSSTIPETTAGLTDDQIIKILGDEIVIVMDASRRPELFDTGDWGGINAIRGLTGTDLREFDPTGAVDWQFFDALARDSGYSRGQDLNSLNNGQTLRLKVGPFTINRFRVANIPLGDIARRKLQP